MSPFQDVADAMTTETMTKRDDGPAKKKKKRRKKKKKKKKKKKRQKKRRPRLTKENVDDALEEIRPYVINDGGNIQKLSGYLKKTGSSR